MITRYSITVDGELRHPDLSTSSFLRELSKLQHRLHIDVVVDSWEVYNPLPKKELEAIGFGE